MITKDWFQGGKSSNGKHLTLTLQLHKGYETKIPLADISNVDEAKQIEIITNNAAVQDVWNLAYGDLKTKIDDLISAAQIGNAEERLKEISVLSGEITEMLKGPK